MLLLVQQEMCTVNQLNGWSGLSHYAKPNMIQVIQQQPVEESAKETKLCCFRSIGKSNTEVCIGRLFV